jgi:PAT family beta-lactamase induction signal transducer AmpG
VFSVRTSSQAAVAFMPTNVVATTNELPGSLRLVADSLDVRVLSGSADNARVSALIEQAKAWNEAHGLHGRKDEPARAASSDTAWGKYVSAPMGAFWSRHVSQPLAGFLQRHFPPHKVARVKSSGHAGVVMLRLSKKPETTITVQTVARASGLARIGIGSADRGFQCVAGERMTFTPENWNVPGAVVLQADPKLKEGLEAAFETRAGNIPLAWSITLLTLAGLFLVFSLWHSRVLPRPSLDGPVVVSSAGGGAMREFGVALGSFFRKPGIIPALAFILLYRFAEAQSVKLLTPFLLDGREVGGLGLSTGQVGFAYGTVGVAMLTCGGLLGGFLAARHGLKKVLLVMVCAIHIPNLAFVYLSMAQPENFAVVSLCVGIEQFGYGFGFTAYMLFLLYFADGPHKTAHYAICTGLMALGMMLPGFFAGWLQEHLGYQQFFVWVMLATLPGFGVAFLIRVDPQFGRNTDQSGE